MLTGSVDLNVDLDVELNVNLTVDLNINLNDEWKRVPAVLATNNQMHMWLKCFRIYREFLVSV